MDENEFIVESCRDKSVSCSYKIMWNPVEIRDVTNLIILGLQMCYGVICECKVVI